LDQDEFWLLIVKSRHLDVRLLFWRGPDGAQLLGNAEQKGVLKLKFVLSIPLTAKESHIWLGHLRVVQN
jgi:hypothetical protein